MLFFISCDWTTLKGGCNCQSALKHGFHEQCKLECKRKLKVNSSYFTVKRGSHRHKHKGKLREKEKLWSLCLGLCLCLHCICICLCLHFYGEIRVVLLCLWWLWKPCLILLIGLPDLVTVMMLWTLLILAECRMHVTHMYDPSSGLQHKSPFSVAQ